MSDSARLKVVKVRLGIEPEEDYLNLPEQCIPEKEIEYAIVPSEFWDLPLPEVIPPEKERWRDKITWSNFKLLVLYAPVMATLGVYSYIFGMIGRD